MDTDKIYLFYITFPNEAEAIQLTEGAIKKGLAACTNIYPITSRYVWKETFVSDDEFVAILKTIPELEQELRSYVEEKHPYECPCVISWEVNVNTSYRKWVESNTKS
jgi:periplasmic divalent cation tolerance protein